MSDRYCIGSKPFKYFMETDPTVPMWVKKIQQNDIETWNTVLNKQDKLTAGKHIIIDNNEISFDHDIDLMASDFQYFPIGEERIWNDLRNYFTTINGEKFSSILITTDTAYMQWQDGLYYTGKQQGNFINGGFDTNNTYKVVESNVEYDVFPYYEDRQSDKVIIDIIESLDNGYTLAYLDPDEHTYEPLSVQINGPDSKSVADENGNNTAPDAEGHEEFENFLLSTREYFIYDENEQEAVRKVFVLKDHDIDGQNVSEFNKKVIEIITTGNKVQPTDEYDSDLQYWVYNRKTDTYSTISLNETTFKERQNGLYIRTSIWDKDTLLTAKNIDQLMYDLVDTAYAHAKDTAYQNFVTNQLKDYVNGRIASLNLNTYATNTALNNLITRFNILANQVNDIDDEVDDISSTREYLITTGNGLNKTYINEGTLNQVTHLELDIRRLDDALVNEEAKKYLHLEDGYNGFYIYNDLVFQDWEYDLTDDGKYIPDGEGGWQKKQLDHYIIGMPFTERLIPKRIAVSSNAVLEELNDNYEMKLITLGSNVQIVDLAYYKQLWGATGATFTEADFKALTAEWYDVNWDYDTPENQAIMKMYTYNGENGERLYRHQRAITFIPSETSDIYAADVYTAISNPEASFATRTEPWYKHPYIKVGESAEFDSSLIYYTFEDDVYTAIDNPTESDFNNREEDWYIDDLVNYVYVSLEESFDSNKTYYTLGSQQSKYTIPSCDGVAKFVESLDLSYTGGKVYLKITERPGTDNARIVDISDATIVDDTTKSTNTTWSSNKIDTEITNAINALDVTEVGGTNKYISAISEADGKISATVGNIDTSVTTNSNNLITSGAVASAIDALPEPMVFKGSVGSGGTVEWSNLDSASASNKGWTYKVITDHNTAPICKVGDTIISDSTTWVVIPSGDEPSGTVTNIATASESNSHLTLTTTNNNPITSTGTITAGVESGYSIPSTSKQTEWDSKIAGVQLNSVDLTKDANNKVNVVVPQVYRFV